MAINPFRKGGNDTIPVNEGGTGATDAASARTNLGAGDLTTAAHASIDHTGLPGVGAPLVAGEIIHRSAPGVSVGSLATTPYTVYTVPANTLTADGEELLVRIVYEVSSVGSVALRATFGGTEIQAAGAYGSISAYFDTYYRFFRTAPTTARYFAYDFGPTGSFNSTTRAGGVFSAIPGLTGLTANWGSNIIFSVENTNATPVVVQYVEVVKRPLVP